MEKDKLKNEIEKFKIKYPNSDLIDNLTLTKDRKLWARDNIIDEYIRACQVFGIEPLQIEKINNSYIIVNIPNNVKNILIPQFVTGIKMAKNFKMISNQNQGYNSISSIMIDTDKEVKTSLEEVKRAMAFQLKMQKDTLGLNNEQKQLLENIIDKLGQSSIKQDSTDMEIKEKISELKSTIDELEKGNYDSEILEQIHHIKSEIQENGKRLFELENLVAPKLKELIKQYNMSISDDTFESCKATDIKCIPSKEYGFISKKNYCLTDEENYKNKMDAYEIKEYLSFNMVQSLKPLVEYTYNTLVAMKVMFDGMDEDTLNEIAEFKGQTNQLNNGISAIKVTGQTTLGVQVESGVNIAKATAIELFRRNKKNNLVKKFKKIYTHPNNVMQEFYEETDKDIAIYLIEYMINKDKEYKNIIKKLKIDGKSIELEYYDLIKLIHKERETETSNKITEEQTIRVAAAYISARKIMNGEDIDLDTVISFKGEYTPEQLDKNNKEHYIGDEKSRKYKEECESLFLLLIKAALVIECLSPKFVEMRVIEALKEIRKKTK